MKRRRDQRLGRGAMPVNVRAGSPRADNGDVADLGQQLRRNEGGSIHDGANIDFRPQHPTRSNTQLATQLNVCRRALHLAACRFSA